MVLHGVYQSLTNWNKPQAVQKMAEALEEAQRRIAELLLHPDDLSLRLTQLKTKFMSEKNSIDAILKTSVQSQLEDTQDGLGVLTSASDVSLIQMHWNVA